MMLRVLAVVSLVVTLAACGILSQRDVPYEESRSQPPLQVPEGLDNPVVDDALRIPTPTPGATDVRGAAAPGAVATSPSGSSLANDTLVIADSAQSAFRRVGVALERMTGEVEILARDEAAGSYRLEVSGTRPARGMLRRLLRREERFNESFDLQLEALPQGTQIRAVGGGETARALLRRLQQRLG